MRARKLTALAVLMVMETTHLMAWKSSLLAPNAGMSPHGRFTRHALDLIQERVPGEKEWLNYGDLIVVSAGQVKNDVNSHGNVILDVAERDFDPNFDPDGTLARDASAFNSGPFYRFWVRMQESAAHLNMGIPRRDSSSRSVQRLWRRFPNRDFKADAIYRYMGYMAHLAEDNAVPAHAANVRHGVYEGLEYWTWGALFLGGNGKKDLEEAEMGQVRTRMNGEGWWSQPTLLSCKRDELIDTAKDKVIEDRGFSGSKSSTAVEGFLTQFVTRTCQDIQMPEFQKDELIFKMVKDGGRRPDDEAACKGIHDYEQNLDYSLFGDPNGSGSAKLITQILAVPQPQYTDRPFQTRYDPGVYAPGLSPQWYYLDGDSFGGKSLNEGRAPYLPNPNYTGKAFDTQWGSYGGYYGFPGRCPPESGAFSAYVGDALWHSASGQIHPGDLFMYHVDPIQYNAGEIRSLYESDSLKFWKTTKYWDERSQGPFDANPAFKGIVALAMKDAVTWAASTLANLSAAIPPVITHFDIKPLARDAKQASKGLVKPSWQISSRGADLELAFQSSRNADFQVEFYAIPADRIVAEPSRPRAAGAYLNCTRKLSLNSKMALWKSDIGVEDMGGDTSFTGGLPTEPDDYGKAPNYRDYDYVYAELPLIPLDVKSASGVEGWVTTLPNKGLGIKGKLAPSSPVYNDVGDLLPNLKLSYETGIQTFKWEGLVGEKPVTLMGDDFQLADGTKQYEHIVSSGNGKHRLKSGAYFILTVLYREGCREVVALNQFKLMSPLKEQLEKSNWWRETTSVIPRWKDALNAKAPATILSDAQQFMIPDELVPILVDLDPPPVANQ